MIYRSTRTERKQRRSAKLSKRADSRARAFSKAHLHSGRAMKDWPEAYPLAVDLSRVHLCSVNFPIRRAGLIEVR